MDPLQILQKLLVLVLVGNYQFGGLALRQPCKKNQRFQSHATNSKGLSELMTVEAQRIDTGVYHCNFRCSLGVPNFEMSYSNLLTLDPLQHHVMGSTVEPWQTHKHIVTIWVLCFEPISNMFVYWGHPLNSMQFHLFVETMLNHHLIQGVVINANGIHRDFFTPHPILPQRWP